jgi:hypothetical protein
MSVDYSALTVVGVKINRADLSEKHEVRGCAHEVPSDATYCPTCGKKIKNIVVAPLPIFEKGNGKVGPFDAIDSRTSDGLVVGVVLGLSGGYCGSFNYYDPTKLDIQKTKAELKALLEPYDLFKENSFGLWTVLRCA